MKLEAAQSSGSLLLTRLCGDFDCIGSLAAISPELGVFPEAISEDLQKLAEEGPPTFDKATGLGTSESQEWGQETGRNE